MPLHGIGASWALTVSFFLAAPEDPDSLCRWGPKVRPLAPKARAELVSPAGLAARPPPHPPGRAYQMVLRQPPLGSWERLWTEG